jgi:hypothetical protein
MGKMKNILLVSIFAGMLVISGRALAQTNLVVFKWGREPMTFERDDSLRKKFIIDKLLDSAKKQLPRMDNLTSQNLSAHEWFFRQMFKITKCRAFKRVEMVMGTELMTTDRDDPCANNAIIQEWFFATEQDAIDANRAMRQFATGKYINHYIPNVINWEWYRCRNRILFIQNFRY